MMRWRYCCRRIGGSDYPDSLGEAKNEGRRTSKWQNHEQQFELRDVA
jgi:hypothetical protein